MLSVLPLTHLDDLDDKEEGEGEGGGDQEEREDTDEVGADARSLFAG